MVFFLSPRSSVCPIVSRKRLTVALPTLGFVRGKVTDFSLHRFMHFPFLSFPAAVMTLSRTLLAAWFDTTNAFYLSTPAHLLRAFTFGMQLKPL